MLKRFDYTVLSEGKPLFVREVLPTPTGRDEYLLFVHGNTFPSIPDFDLSVEGRSFAAFMAKRDVRCCMFDSRGYGRSYKTQKGEANGVSERARDLEAVYCHLIGKRGAGRISLFGLSTGCNVIAAFLDRLPPDDTFMDRVVFSGPCYLYNPKTTKLHRQLSLLRAVRSLVGRSGDLYFSFGEGRLKRRLLRGEESLIDRAACEVFIRDALDMFRPGGRRLEAPVLGFPDSASRYAPWQRLFNTSRLTYPLLILRGERDRYCCEETAERLLEEVPARSAKLVTVPGANHDMHLYRDPQIIFQEISDFLSSDERYSHVVYH